MSKHAAHSATRDEVLATRTGSLATYCATSDTHATYWVLGPVPGNGDAVYAYGNRHQNLVMVTRTGTALVKGKGPQVRVRIDFAVDNGDANGTLAFGTRGQYIGGVAPKVLFS